MKKSLTGTAAAALLAVAAFGAGTAGAETTTGKVTLKLTSPRQYVGPARTANITCTSGASYVARFGRSTQNGRTISGSLVVPVYTGPGDYKASITMRVTGASGGGVGTLRNVPVTITDSGGTARFSTTFTGANAPRLAGKVVAGTIDWTCPS